MSRRTWKPGTLVYPVPAVLITCKDFNIPSKRVIEKNGGIYENSYYNEEDKYTYLRYWINLKVRVI